MSSGVIFLVRRDQRVLSDPVMWLEGAVPGHRRQTLQSYWGTSHTLDGIFVKRPCWKKFRVQIHYYITFKCDFEVSSLEGI